MAQKEQKEKAPPKPKPMAQATLVVHDNGQITGDFYVWEENEVGRRKKWTVSGADFMQFLNRAQPNNVPVIAGCLNVQAINAGIEPERQGPWVRRGEDGNPEIWKTPSDESLHTAELTYNMPSKKSPMPLGKGVQVAQDQESAAQEEIDNNPEVDEQ